MPAVPCVRPSQGSVHAPAKGTARNVFQFARGFGHQQADLPMPGMEAKGNGSPFSARRPPCVLRIRNSDRAGAQDPSHAGILTQAEEITRRFREQHFRGKR